MGVNYIVGNLVDRAVTGMLSASWFPLTRYVPRGQYWLYDIQRIAGRRDLSVIFDVGANVGQTARSLVRYFPRADIYCFEPVRETFAALKSDCGGFAHCENTALGATAGVASIELHGDSELNTLRPSSYATIGKEQVQITTIDAFCEERGLKEISILNIDVQGSELDVVKALRP